MDSRHQVIPDTQAYMIRILSFISQFLNLLTMRFLSTSFFLLTFVLATAKADLLGNILGGNDDSASTDSTSEEVQADALAQEEDVSTSMEAPTELPVAPEIANADASTSMEVESEPAVFSIRLDFLE